MYFLGLHYSISSCLPPQANESRVRSTDRAFTYIDVGQSSIFIATKGQVFLVNQRVDTILHARCQLYVKSRAARWLCTNDIPKALRSHSTVTRYSPFFLLSYSVFLSHTHHTYSSSSLSKLLSFWFPIAFCFPLFPIPDRPMPFDCPSS